MGKRGRHRRRSLPMRTSGPAILGMPCPRSRGHAIGKSLTSQWGLATLALRWMPQVCHS